MADETFIGGRSLSSVTGNQGPNKDEINVKGGELKIDNTAIDASADELDYLSGVTAGTAAASKALVTDANSAVNILRTASLRLGASGSETTVTATGTELNLTSGKSALVDSAYANIGGADAVRWALSDIKGEVCDVADITTTYTMVDGRCTFNAVYVPVGGTITGVAHSVATQGDTTADNENRVGLYTSDGTNLTLVASSADDGTTWESGAGNVEVAFSTPYVATAGVYWIATLTNWSAAVQAPVIRAATTVNNPNPSVYGFNNPNERLWSYVASATLPASQAWTGVTSAGARPWLALY